MFDSLIHTYARKGLLIDTNVLLVLIVGLVDEGLVGRFRRTSSYTAEDFHLLRRLVRPFARIVTTPQILAELSNLSPTGRKDALAARYFSQLVGLLREAHERHVAKDVMIRSTLLPRIGFTDLSILEAARNREYLVLTDDLRCAEYLRAANCDVINLNQLRGEIWLNQ